jgi:hypothetical protein
MPMSRQRVVSREYKVMLNAGKFAGDHEEFQAAAVRFWRELKDALGAFVVDARGKFDKVKSRRLIRFYDTNERHLINGDYIFRERRDLDSNEREATLKFRHADRYVAQCRDMQARHRDRGRTKFEEDIKVPFVTLYSYSTTQPIDDEDELQCLNDIARLFPDIADRLEDFRG